MAAVQPNTSRGLREILRAYRETVMAVPHYEREYGDTLQESLAEELGVSLAERLVRGELVTPQLFEALVKACERKRDGKQRFRRVLRRERDSLAESMTELNSIEERVVTLARDITAADSSEQLSTIDDRLEHLESRCRALATRRQETIHDRSTGKLSGVDEVSLVRYRYSDLEKVMPALSDIAACLETIRNQRTRCLR